jgi:hypothetical protein
MALTQEEIDDAARKTIERIFVADNVTAHSTFPDIVAAMQAIENGMNATTDAAATAYPVTPVKNAFLEYARTGAPNLTVQEGGIALAYWALKTVGLL